MTTMPVGADGSAPTDMAAGLAPFPSAVALHPELRQALATVARAPQLLVACDYDGTLAPITGDPWSVRPLPEAASALRSLATLPATTAAVISGRALRELAVMSRLPDEVHLVGSHGSEFDIGFVHTLDRRARALNSRIVDALRKITHRQPGTVLEVKPAGVAVHVRQADPAVAEEVLAKVRSGPGAWDGVYVTEGSSVVELSVVRTDKGDALDALRHRCGATAAVFVGDDTSAEEVFARLAGPDLGIKVGNGDTLAVYRVRDPYEAAVVLSMLAELRSAWLYGEAAAPIERLSLLGNGRSLALVTPDATVCWQCVPGPTSGALFAHLLGGTPAGHFSVRPEREVPSLGQRYVNGTMTLETRWPGLLVTDYLARDAAPHGTDLIRLISGSAPAVVEFAPRPEFGQVMARLEARPDGLIVAGTSSPIALRSPGIAWEIMRDGGHESARAVVQPSPGRPVELELRCGTSDLSPHGVAEPSRREVAQTWSSHWLGRLTLPARDSALVARSALTLRALCYADTGAIMAAATTSLPETIGGIRNWDYRYCWPRDAAMTARALVSLGSTVEADAFLDWLRGILSGLPGPEQLRPVYSLDGGSPGPEAVIDVLPGYAGSRPVRIGNLAGQQVQLDVFGAVVELVYDLTLQRGYVTDADWTLVIAMCEAVAGRWQEPDHGIWEERLVQGHHVHSKVMCWAAIDRAIRIAERCDRAADPFWAGLRDAIAADVLANGWNETIKAFTATYDSSELDAATLHVSLSGLLDAADHRFQATITAVEAELRAGGTVYRYRRDDGLPGREGGFHLCTAWLIEAYLLTGRRDDAEELFSQLIAAAGPTGLLPEEYDPVSERSLGNHPQAYSHVGLIRCAQQLSRFSRPPRGDNAVSAGWRA
jgi:trehalose 6-phosphate phosphatase